MSSWAKDYGELLQQESLMEQMKDMKYKVRHDKSNVQKCGEDCLDIAHHYRKIPRLSKMMAKVCNKNSMHITHSVFDALIYPTIYQYISDNEWNKVLKHSCLINNTKYIHLAVKNGGHGQSCIHDLSVNGCSQVNKWDMGLKWACCKGNTKVALLMMKNGANNLNFGLEWACYGGHISMVNLMISNGAKNWNDGLYGACHGGHLKIVELMILKGATNWKFGLRGSRYGGNVKIESLMIDKGMSNFLTKPCNLDEDNETLVFLKELGSMGLKSMVYSGKLESWDLNYILDHL